MNLVKRRTQEKKSEEVNVFKVTLENKKTGHTEISYLQFVNEEKLISELSPCIKGTSMTIKSIEYIKPEDYLTVMGPIRSKKFIK